MLDVHEKIQSVVRGAYLKYGQFTSTHEAYGVLAEEVAELLDEIRANNRDGVINEAIDVAAVATRLAIAAAYCAIPFHRRSGFDG